MVHATAGGTFRCCVIHRFLQWYGWQIADDPRLWLYTVDHTYDQIIQSQATKKMIGQIAGQGNITLTLDQQAVTEETAGADRADAAMSMRDNIREQASSLYTELFGQYDPRLKLNNLRNLTTNDQLCKGILAPQADPVSARPKKR